MRKKVVHKELKSFLCDRGILHSNNFNLIYCKLFKHMTTKLPHLLQILVVKFVSVFCGTSDIIFKWKEVPDHGYTC